MIRALLLAMLARVLGDVDQAGDVDLVPDDCDGCGYPLGCCCCVVAR